MCFAALSKVSTNLHQFSQIRFVKMSVDLWTMGNVANINFQWGRVNWSFERAWEDLVGVWSWSSRKVRLKFLSRTRALFTFTY